MANISNSDIVSRAIDILSNEYRKVMVGSFKKHGMNFGGNVDFSQLKTEIMSALESGETESIESIIHNFAEGKIKNFEQSGEKMAKMGYSGVHRDIINSLVEFNNGGINEKCAAAILENVTLTKTNEQTVPKELNNNPEQTNPISFDEAMQKNAQAVYERIGTVPEGYVLNEEGKVAKDSRVIEQRSEGNKEISDDGMEIE